MIKESHGIHMGQITDHCFFFCQLLKLPNIKSNKSNNQ